MLSAKKIRPLIMVLAVAAAPAFVLAACAHTAPDNEVDDDDDASPAASSSSGGTGDGICLMNNCDSDEQCGGCSDNRNTCLVAENRCVACDPISGMGCSEGEVCSSFGICAPAGQFCPTDEHGTPQINCTQNADCLACSPMHQVCDTVTGQCQACTGSDTSHCLQSDICQDGSCSAKCPDSCTTDNDCGQCGGPGNEAHACNSHKCAECSDTYPCPSGLECVAGSCVPQCGIPGPVAGDCLADEDCSYCGDGQSPGAWECKKSFNQNGPGDHGTCGPAAAGCSDLGSNVAVLPAPWDQVTNLCSIDNDCAGVGIAFNVGKAIRDIIGSNEIDLGFHKVPIADANVTYDMGTCADVKLTENISCGVCVPCEVDADCQPIAIDPLISNLFAGDPLATIAGALLIDLLYGSNPDHNLNFYCQPVAAGYGVCAPCSNPMQACGTNQAPSNGGGSNTCDHSPCDTGNALSASCDTCAASVCANDPYCCDTAWDSVCVSEVAQYCGTNTCSGGGGGSGCVHSECAAGDALVASCSTCATAVCNADPYCCNTAWDSVCVNQVDQYCGTNTCGGGGGGGGGCAHSECISGDPLVSSCSPCATDVCAQDSYCCTTAWDSICTDIAKNSGSCSC
ncbi:MAG: hypothetical protein JRI68_02445 [Deltaproteobacteria bacterium]|nr:hypothetical protein [Deltaproteobacteria bacterium]